MQYQPDFFAAYRKYLDDPAVKATHARMFKIFDDHFVCGSMNRVVDLGCGTCEFARYMDEQEWMNSYHGFDLDISRADVDNIDNVSITLKEADFTTGDVIEPHDMFVSLFASEIILPWDEHEKLYDKWFEKGASIGLVAGFHYLHCPHFPQVTEKTGYTVYQTTPSSPMRSELRMCQQVPPGMFVDPFVEVWRVIWPSK